MDFQNNLKKVVIEALSTELNTTFEEQVNECSSDIEFEYEGEWFHVTYDYQLWIDTHCVSDGEEMFEEHTRDAIVTITSVINIDDEEVKELFTEEELKSMGKATERLVA